MAELNREPLGSWCHRRAALNSAPSPDNLLADLHTFKPRLLTITPSPLSNRLARTSEAVEEPLKHCEDTVKGSEDALGDRNVRRR
jgi:hypothetical protein